MSDTGERHDNFPENRSEFGRYNKEHVENSKKLGIGEWRNKIAQSAKRSIVAVRNRKIFPRSK